MFGSEFVDHPEILIRSFRDMHDDYRRRGTITHGVFAMLQSLYVRLFGVPEIGFQVRSLYFRQALRAISINPNSRVLDMGSGIGCYVMYLAKQFPHAVINGWEIDEEKIRIARLLIHERGIPNIGIEKRDVTRVPTQKKYYDLVIIIDVLEHIREYKKAIRVALDSLKKGGYLYIHVPQINQRRIFKGFTNWTHSDHLREGFSPELFKKELKKMGFSVISIRNSFGFFGSFAWELNHMSLSTHFILAGFTFPLLYMIAAIDLIQKNKRGLGISILLRKT